MNRQTKIILIGLAVLGLLYIGTVGVGFRSGNDKDRKEDEPAPDWAKSMGGVLPDGKPYVALDGITIAGGLTKGKATINNQEATVTFRAISPPANYVRKVKIKLRSDSPVTLTYLDKTPFSKEETASSKSKWKKNISKSGGTLTLSSKKAATPYTIEFLGSK